MDEFLFHSECARKLYHACARKLPIIDYHNHLSLNDLKENKRYTNIYELWIAPDPYKHRAMRMCGVEERLITGEAAPEEKFYAYCKIFPELVGNPLYIWSLMELQTVFECEDIPKEENAQELYAKLNDYLGKNRIDTRYLLDLFQVEYAFPCTSLLDDISLYRDEKRLAPSLRGDDILCPTAEWMKKLAEDTVGTINSLDDFCSAIAVRLDEFSDVGCRFADHALDEDFVFFSDDGKNEERFAKMTAKSVLTEEDKKRLSSFLLIFLMGEYARRGWILQLHIGALRYTSTRLRKLAGAAGGFAAIGNSLKMSALTTLLDTAEQGKWGLPKTIIFPLNPSYNAAVSVLSGSYSKDGISGLITQGPAWWWCDHLQGMREMLDYTASFGTLGNFVGMTTDSRSFLSFVRHDYFRRVLCNWVSEKMSNGEFPISKSNAEELIYKMCYANAKNAVTDQGSYEM